MGRPTVELRTRYGEMLLVTFEHDPASKPRTFSWAACTPGSTMAILYAEKDMYTSCLTSQPADGIIQEDLDTVYVFKADQDKLLKAADNLVATSSCNPAAAAADNEPVCFSCGKTARAAGCDQNLRACSKCQKAKYCSRECQLAD